VLVKDTGIRIAPEIQPKLYSKFATNLCQGMRLGLYISKNIIEKAWRQSMG
jgi:C4-dicarboxylate-specific signal transduction histidine kinase